MKIEITSDALKGGDNDLRLGEITDRLSASEAVRLIQAGYAVTAPDGEVSRPASKEEAEPAPIPKARASKPAPDQHITKE